MVQDRPVVPQPPCTVGNQLWACNLSATRQLEPRLGRSSEDLDCLRPVASSGAEGAEGAEGGS